MAFRDGALSTPGPDSHSQEIPETACADMGWTASKCALLLSSLQDRFEALQEASGVDPSGPPADQIHHAGIGSSMPTKTRCKRTLEPSLEETEGTKRLKRTYSRKHTLAGIRPGITRRQAKEGHHSHTVRQDECAVRGAACNPVYSKVCRTSTILRPVWHSSMNPRATPSCEEAEHHIRPIRACLADHGALRDAVAGYHNHVYEGILHDLDALHSEMGDSSLGLENKSLLAMCLRKYPGHAVAVYASAEALDQTRISSKVELSRFTLTRRDHIAWQPILTDLEQLGLSGTRGIHLKMAAEAAALHIIKEAITTSLIAPSFANILIRYYDSISRPYNALDILQAIGTNSNPIFGDILRYWTVNSYRRGRSPSPNPETRTTPITRLCHGISSLLAIQPFPTQWISVTKLARLLLRTCEEIPEVGAGTTALQCAVDVLTSLCSTSLPGSRQHQEGGSEETELSSAFLHILGALVGFALTSTHTEATVPKTGRQRPAAIWTSGPRKVLHVLEAALAALTSKRCNVFATFSLELAIFFVSLNSHERGIRVTSAWELALKGSCRNRHGLASIVTAVVCSIAHNLGSASTVPASYHFSWLCDQVGAVGLLGTCERRGYGAFLLAQKTRDLRDLGYAESHNAQVRGAARLNTKGGVGDGPGSSSYVWEEGISEWVLIGTGGGGSPPTRQNTS